MIISTKLSLFYIYLSTFVQHISNDSTTPHCKIYPANKSRRWANVGLRLAQCCRQWPNSKPTLTQRLVFVGYILSMSVSIVLVGTAFITSTTLQLVVKMELIRNTLYTLRSFYHHKIRCVFVIAFSDRFNRPSTKHDVWSFSLQARRLCLYKLLAATNPVKLSPLSCSCAIYIEFQ